MRTAGNDDTLAQMLYIGAKLGPCDGKVLEIKKGIPSKPAQTVSTTKHDAGSICTSRRLRRSMAWV